MTREEGLAVEEGWQGLPGISELCTDIVDKDWFSKNSRKGVLRRICAPEVEDRWQLEMEEVGRRGRLGRPAGRCCRINFDRHKY